MGIIKDRNSMDITESEDIKKWQEYTDPVPPFSGPELQHRAGRGCVEAAPPEAGHGRLASVLRLLQIL